jgi:hypothetical protein
MHKSSTSFPEFDKIYPGEKNYQHENKPSSLYSDDCYF